MSDWKDGELPERGKAREHAKRVLEDPAKGRRKGHPDDERTRDDALTDPAHNEGDET